MIITFIKILITVVFSIVYVPMNWFFMKLQKWYLPLYKKDRFLYFALAPFYWTFVGINAIISVPYETIAESIH